MKCGRCQVMNVSANFVCLRVESSKTGVGKTRPETYIRIATKHKNFFLFFASCCVVDQTYKVTAYTVIVNEGNKIRCREEE